MNREEKRENLTNKINAALDKAIKKVIAETKATNTYMVVSDGKGGFKKIPAKDL
ncbi:MAG: hypothetical protein QM726_03200 [Chitinophagaceae bacterium]